VEALIRSIIEHTGAQEWDQLVLSDGFWLTNLVVSTYATAWKYIMQEDSAVHKTLNSETGVYWYAFLLYFEQNTRRKAGTRQGD